MKWLWCLGIVGAFAIGCGDAETGAGGPDGSFSIKWGPTEVPAQSEATDCVVRRLGNPEGTFIHEIQNVLGATSHHFIVYRVNDTVEQLEPQPCQPFLDVLEDPPLIITQRAEDRLVLPEGVAYQLEADQMIRLELHYVNPSAAPQMAEATSTFVPMPAEEVTDLADVMFLGDVNITIPPTSLHTVGPTYIRIPERFNGVNYFAITGHEHQWGTNVFVEAVPDAVSPGTPVYDVVNFRWDEPETVTHDPPFQLPDGGGFNLTCDWNNQSGSRVEFGTGVDDEMCFFWAYYYPSQGPLVLF
ncbi:MAG: hypothetical protein AAF436_01080 [Myxococcota bacterium]